MNKYEIKTEWWGYSRGTSTYIVEAEDEAEAREFYYEGECTHNQVVRDDRENEIRSVEKLTLLSDAPL